MVRSVAAVAPGLALEQVPVDGPPVSFDLRAAVWAEAAVLAAAVRLAPDGRSGDGGPVTGCPSRWSAPEAVGPWCAVARTARSTSRWRPGRVLDAVVLRSYAIGAAHQALGWVGSEGIAVAPDGRVQDLTVRSFGILQARAMPEVTVRLRGRGGGRGRSTGPTPCSPRWPPPGGWPTGSPRRGPPTDPVPDGAEACPSGIHRWSPA